MPNPLYKNQTTYFNGIERAKPFLLYWVAGGHNNSLIINKSGHSKQMNIINFHSKTNDTVLLKTRCEMQKTPT